MLIGLKELPDPLKVNRSLSVSLWFTLLLSFISLLTQINDVCEDDFPLAELRLTIVSFCWILLSLLYRLIWGWVARVWLVWLCSLVGRRKPWGWRELLWTTKLGKWCAGSNCTRRTLWQIYQHLIRLIINLAHQWPWHRLCKYKRELAY